MTSLIRRMREKYRRMTSLIRRMREKYTRITSWTTRMKEKHTHITSWTTRMRENLTRMTSKITYIKENLILNNYFSRGNREKNTGNNPQKGNISIIHTAAKGNCMNNLLRNMNF